MKYPFRNSGNSLSGNSLSISYVHVSYSFLLREFLMNHLPERQQKVNRGFNYYLFGENMRFSVSSKELFCEFPPVCLGLWKDHVFTHRAQWQDNQRFEFNTCFGVPSISAPHTASLPPRQPASAWTLEDSCNSQKRSVEIQLQQKLYVFAKHRIVKVLEHGF